HFDPTAFFLVDEVTDVFGETTTIAYDTEELFVTSVTAPLSLTTSAEIDYRVLAPKKVTDPNGNHTEAAFDALGRVRATALGGANGEGDDLSGPDSPTTRITYELDRYAASGLP